MTSISQRLGQIPASPIRKLVPMADAAKARGVSVIHLNIGDPDIPTPKVMTDRLRGWQENIPYAHSQGDKELLTALLGYYHNLGYGYLKQEQIQVTVGGSEALAMAMTAVCEAGEEIMVFEPFFTCYAGLAVTTGIKLLPITTSISNGFHLPDDLEVQMERLVTTKTKAIILTNPNNPTGTVYTKEEVERLIALAKKHDLFLLADEVYREFVFTSERGVSLLDYMEGEPERLIVLDSLSKRYSAPGLRLGMIVSLNQELMAGVLRLGMTRLSAGYIDQKVASALAQISHEDILIVREEYRRRRDAIFEVMGKIPGVKIHQPEGAFYCVVSLPVVDAERFCSWLLTDFEVQGETVMLAPMRGFYATEGLGLNEIRIAYVVGVEKLRRAGEILAKALEEYHD